MTIIRLASRRRFTAIDRATINDERLSFRAKGVLVWLLDKPEGYRIDSTDMASRAREGRDAIRSALTELEDAGYLVRHRRQVAGGRWVTEVLVHEQPPTPENPSSVPTPEKPTSENQALVLLPTEMKKTPCSPPRGDARAEVPMPRWEEFEQWWKAYPRSTDKAKAREAWIRADRNGLLPPIGELLDAVSAYVACEKVREGVVLHGSTWLNRRRWEDELDRPEPAEPSAPACSACGVLYRGPMSCLDAQVCPMVAADA